MKIEDIYKDFPPLESDRIILRKLTEADAEDLFAYASKEEVTKYVFWERHRSITDSEEFIAYALNQYKKSDIAPWGIEWKENGKFIGTIDFVSWQPHHKTAEIGYVIAGKLLLKFGFEQMDLVRIQARCFVHNHASARVMEKLGMRFEGILRKELFVKGTHQDTKLYSILKEEWES